MPRGNFTPLPAPRSLPVTWNGGIKYASKEEAMVGGKIVDAGIPHVYNQPLRCSCCSRSSWREVDWVFPSTDGRTAIRGAVPREQRRWLEDEKRRAAKAKISQVTGETAEYVEIIRRDPCAYCGAPMKHVDHIVPFADGGPTDWTNLAPACAKCNHRKSRTPLLLFLLAERGGEADGRAA